MASRLKVLVSAFYCRPNEGSENGIGWNWVQIIARNHDVWVMTLDTNRPFIEKEIAKNPMPNVHWIYFDLASWLPQSSKFFYYPSPLRFPYYYLWQMRSYFVGKRWLKQVDFDVAHHITIGRYWMPSFLAMLPIPMVWGPVGGGENTPKAFYKLFSTKERTLEYARDFARVIFRFDPFMRMTVHRASIALGTTRETTAGMANFGAKNTDVLSQVAITDGELEQLGKLTLPPATPFRFVSIGRIIQWKGYELGIRAFARMLKDFPEAEYWFIGDGGDRTRLEQLAAELGIADKMKFWGNVPRERVLELLENSHVLVHPSLHDSGGMAVSEAMAAGRPVICLDLGGPGHQVTEEAGLKITATSPEQAIEDMHQAMLNIARDRSLLEAKSQLARERVQSTFSWSGQSDRINEIYHDVVGDKSAESVVTLSV